MPHAEIHILGKCNLKCANCVNQSPLHTWIKTKEEIFLSITNACKYLHFSDFAILGGEPFLHPELPDIIKGISTILSAHRLRHPFVLHLYTNGTITDRLDMVDLARTIKECHARVQISQHLHDTPPLVDWCVKNGINVHLVPLIHFCATPEMEMSQKNNIALTNPCLASEHCQSKCFPIHHDKIFRCTRHVARLYNCEYGINNGQICTPEYKKFVMQYDGLTLNGKQTPLQIRQYLYGDASIPECAMCANIMYPLSPQSQIQ